VATCGLSDEPEPSAIRAPLIVQDVAAVLLKDLVIP